MPRKNQYKKKTHINQNFNDGIASLTNSLSNSRNASFNNAIVSKRLTHLEMNEIFKTGLGNKIVRFKVDNAYKEGLTFEDKKDQEYFDKVLLKRVRQASKWLLAFGRGVIAIVEPNKLTTEPLSSTINLNTVLLHVFDGSIITAQSVNRDLKSTQYQKPDFYQIKGANFHHSRIVDFTYIEPTQDDLPDYNYGGISEYELINTQLINDGIIERSAPTILDKSASLFYKVKGLKQAIMSGNESKIVEYFRLVEDHRSNYGAGLLDAEDSVEVVSQALTNLAETDQITLRRLAMVTGIPLSELIGETVKGLGATGDGEKSTANAMITTLQKNYFIEPINELNQKLGLKEATFNQPEQMTPKEKADYQEIILRNASSMDMLGLDSAEYLSENGFEVKAEPSSLDKEFNEVE